MNYKLKELFKSFRTDKANAEMAFVDTAVDINTYISQKKSITQIVEDFNTGKNSAVYSGFDHRGKRSLGALLFLKLLVDTYLEPSVTEPEKTPLTTISTMLGDIYSAPRVHKAKIKELFPQVLNWLNTYALQTSDKPKAHTLCKGVYTALICLKLYIQENQGFVLNNALSGIMTYKELITNLGDVIQTTIEQTQILETQINSAKKPLKLYFEDRLEAIARNHNTTPQTKIANLQSETQNIIRNIEALIVKRRERIQLKASITSISSLEQAIKKNDTFAYGRKYFTDLIIANQEQYAVLQTAKPQAYQELETLKTAIAKESAAKAKAKYLISWVTSPITVAARAITSQRIQDAVNYVAPETSDSLAKQRLKTIVREALEDLQLQSDRIEREILTLENSLANQNDELLSDIQAANEISLQQIKTDIPAARDQHILNLTPKPLPIPINFFDSSTKFAAKIGTAAGVSTGLISGIIIACAKKTIFASLGLASCTPLGAIAIIAVLTALIFAALCVLIHKLRTKETPQLVDSRPLMNPS